MEYSFRDLLVETRTALGRPPSGYICSYPLRGGLGEEVSKVLFGWIGKWLKPADCKSVPSWYVGSNPTPPTSFKEQ